MLCPHCHVPRTELQSLILLACARSRRRKGQGIGRKEKKRGIGERGFSRFFALFSPPPLPFSFSFSALFAPATQAKSCPRTAFSQAKNRSFQPHVGYTGASGRPKIRVTKEQLTYLVDNGFKGTDMARTLYVDHFLGYTQQAA